MPSFTLNGQPFPYGPVTSGEISYPAQILDSWSDAQLAEIGVVRSLEPVEPPAPTPQPDPPPAPPGQNRVCSVFEFMFVRITQAERIAIRESVDPVVVDFVATLDFVTQIELDGALTGYGLQYLESVGLLAPGRAAQILA